MNRTTRFVPFAAALLSIVALDACRRQPVATPEPAPVNQDSIDAARRAEAERAAAERAAAERARAERARQDSIAAAARNAEAVRAALVEAVHFDLDSDAIRGEAQQRLDAKLGILNANPGVTLRIAGHADERGSDEYNLALGLRRANSVRRYLADRGIAMSRMETVSYGEERPAAAGSDEGAWAQNRRAEFEITSGGTTLVRPRM